MHLVDPLIVQEALERGAERATLILNKDWLSLEETEKYLGKNRGYVQRFLEENAITKSQLYSTQRGAQFVYSRASIDQTLTRLSKRAQQIKRGKRS